jgi:hypothetical protein
MEIFDKMKSSAASARGDFFARRSRRREYEAKRYSVQTFERGRYLPARFM